METRVRILVLGLALVVGCTRRVTGDGTGGVGATGGTGGTGGQGGTGAGTGGKPGVPIEVPAAACDPAPGGGQRSAAAPMLRLRLANGDDEGWLGSPAVADLDGDGKSEIIAARGTSVVVWDADGKLRGSVRLPGGRIWAAPLVGNFAGDDKLEIVAACRGTIAMLDASLKPAAGFPVTWRDEIRSLAAADLDGDGTLEIVAGNTMDLVAGGQRDILTAFRSNGAVVPGFPPNTSGTSGCDDHCYTHAGFDQNLALGPIDAVGGADIFLPQDNAYVSIHQGNGVAFAAAPIFHNRAKVLGVRFMHDYAEAQQGYGDDEETALQAHFTNTAPAIADLDGDGVNELIFVGSVQNASQSDRKKGVALWVLHSDGTRPPAWVAPLHIPAYLSGLDDLGDNIVGLTNQVAVADVDGAVPGLEMVFAGFDGKLHLVGTDRQERWTYVYTSEPTVLTAGVAIADLSGDGVPEIVFATYSTDAGKSALIVLDAAGTERARVALPGRGAMAVPTVADLDHDGTLEVVVSLKDGAAADGSVLVFSVPGSSPNCLPWPTGRANQLRTGYLRRK
jgi:hypothetical protein